MSYYSAMDDGFTVAELAKKVAEHERDLDLVTRRIRHWSLAGVLDPLGPTHSGTGRHRRYAGSAVYCAAVLNRLADWGLPISVLKVVGQRLPDHLTPQLCVLWNDSISGKRGVCMLLVYRSAPDRQPEQQLVTVDLKPDAEIAEWIAAGQGGVIVHLTNLFARVSS